MPILYCPRCGFNKKYDSLPSNVSYAKCPKCQQSFRINLQELKRLPENKIFQSESSSTSSVTCPSCNTTNLPEDARCYACGKTLDFAVPKEGSAVELNTWRFLLGSVCIGVAVLLLCIALPAASWVSNKGVGRVSHSEGAEILLILGVALIAVILLGFVGTKLAKPTPVKTATFRKR